MAGRKKGEVGKVESDREKFERLGVQRMTNALKYINLVGNLAGPGYEYTEGDVTLIVTTLQEAVDRVKDRFEGKSVSGGGFRFRKS
jgi:hypothetical protein